MYKYMLAGLLVLASCAGPQLQSQSAIGYTEHTAASAGGSTGSIGYGRAQVNSEPVNLANAAVAHTDAGAGSEE